MTTIVHGTAVAFNGRAVLLRGTSGAGKSDLALRLLALPRAALVAFGVADAGRPSLIADDRVALEARQDGAAVWARAPSGLPAAIEVRGVGLVAVELASACEVVLIVDLVSTADVERLPGPDFEAVCGVGIKRLRLSALHASTPLKIALAVQGVPLL